MSPFRLTVLLCAMTGPLAAHGENTQEPVALLKIELTDGSILKARAKDKQLRISPSQGEREGPVQWKLIRKLENDPESPTITAFLADGEELDVRWTGPALKVETVVGRLRIPAAKISTIENLGEDPGLANIALGKPVSGRDGASYGRGLAKHLTDGDYATHAKPPAFHFDYSIDLRDGDNDHFSVHQVRIHWGPWGDRFKGIPNEEGEGWKPAAWPGDYVKSYQLEYRASNSEEWSGFHQCGGRPVEEDANGVHVERLATEMAGASSEVITTISGLELEKVAGIRIRAKGGSHWVGIHELEVFGHP